MEALKISMTGLDVEWQRLQVIAQNLANVNSTRDAAGQTYRAKRLTSGPDVSFSALLSGTSHLNGAAGVHVTGIEDTGRGVRRVLDPEHPHADLDGFVSYPQIDHATEMALMIKTARVYEANLTALTMARQMYSRALEMGR